MLKTKSMAYDRKLHGFMQVSLRYMTSKQKRYPNSIMFCLTQYAETAMATARSKHALVKILRGF